MVGGREVVGLGFIFAEVGSVVSSPIVLVVVGTVTIGEVPKDPGNCRFFPDFLPPCAFFFACFTFVFSLFFLVFWLLLDSSDFSELSSGFFLFLDLLVVVLIVVVVASSVAVAGVVRRVSVLSLDLSDSSSLRTNLKLKNKDHIGLNNVAYSL